VHRGEYLPTSCGTTTSRGATQTTPDPLLVDSPDEEFDAKVSDITQLYMSGASKARRTHRVDEMTGIQALERLAPDLPLRPGKVQRREYIRHGTQSLIANFDVATGQVICPTCGDTRTEVDFAAHVRVLIESEPDAKNGI